MQYNEYVGRYRIVFYFDSMHQKTIFVIISKQTKL